eukprot:jgi/Phyca11/128089/e_gw1.73.133.1
MAPVLEPPEEDSETAVIQHNAEAHRDAMVLILHVFGKTIDQVAFLVSDNCSLNKRLARLLDAPLVGCASHRLNLAVTLVTASLESVLVKIQGLVVRLRTLNESAKLRFKTKLRPVLRQDTRWGSTFKMLHRYFDLLEYIDRADENLAEFIPSASENKKLKVLLSALERVQSVSLQLQSDGVMLWEVRVLFVALLKDMPALKRYLGATGAIVASPDFESACLIHTIPPTSNLAERLFSVARATYGLDRHSLLPISLEMLLFLRANERYWDAETIHQCLD